MPALDVRRSELVPSDDGKKDTNDSGSTDTEPKPCVCATLREKKFGPPKKRFKNVKK